MEKQSIAENQSIADAKVKAAYGACEDVPVMEEWSQPDVLLMNIWSALGQILVPMGLVVVYNNPGVFHASSSDAEQTRRFFMLCQNQGHSWQVEWACVWTTPAVRLFPVLGVSLPVLLALWKVLHLRAYYMFMRNRIMICFAAGSRLGFKCGLALSVIFAHALAHFALLIFFGHPCEEEHCRGQHILNTGWKDFLNDPATLQRDKTFVLAATRLAVQYIVPGALSLIFVFGMDNFVAELVPMGLYFDHLPSKRYENLGRYMYIKEDVIEVAVKRIMASASELQPQSMEQLCLRFQETAKAMQCKQLGESADLEEETQSESLQLEEKGFAAGVRELILLEWWPLRLLLEFPLVDEVSVRFCQFLAAHLVASTVLLGLMTTTILRRCVILVRTEMMDLESGDFIPEPDAIYPFAWYLCLGLVLGVATCRVLSLTWRVTLRLTQSPEPTEP
mmetsp:Transcript_121422/g.288512  ORF Transcript_121422/g.288512 Transcript_121422/m.288512 type:complete len:448 (+) Transcript_121422:81-1424(+)|eukprot:CAMPEP_0181463482 /NCGR_PEP_ID=MMETSP1110-20121109/34938_1 /TAXON_ID=174948 /ORGANISM="Symbiodinium sp., Strain CCMP421" /LENGTH=447 /DNA_ID=CAMNT_0023588183 /DNA_START=80 /DNA_END=1423 /DNA_ORIENTATION=+